MCERSWRQRKPLVGNIQQWFSTRGGIECSSNASHGSTGYSASTRIRTIMVDYPEHPFHTYRVSGMNIDLCWPNFVFCHPQHSIIPVPSIVMIVTEVVIQAGSFNLFSSGIHQGNERVCRIAPDPSLRSGAYIIKPYFHHVTFDCASALWNKNEKSVLYEISGNFNQKESLVWRCAGLSTVGWGCLCGLSVLKPRQRSVGFATGGWTPPH